MNILELTLRKIFRFTELIGMILLTAFQRTHLGDEEEKAVLKFLFKFSRYPNVLLKPFNSSILLYPLRISVERFGTLSHYVLVPLVTGIYILLGLVSNIPFPFMSELELGVLIWIMATAMYLIGSWLGEKISSSLCSVSVDSISLAHFSLPIMLSGLLGLIYNYVTIGTVPLLNPELRRHNLLWMVSYDTYLLFSAIFLASLAKALEEGRISKGFLYETSSTVLLITAVITFPSGFRLDIFVALITLLIVLWSYRIIKARTVVFYLLVPLAVAFVGQKYVLTVRAGTPADPLYIVVSRAGFTLYALSLIIKHFNWTGLSYGKLIFVNPLLTMFGVPRLLVGPFLGRVIVGLPEAYTSSFVGPLWADFGVIGTMVVPLMIGGLTGIFYRISRSRSPVFTAFYSILTTAMLVWIESGPVHPYLYLLYFFALLLLPLMVKKCNN